MTADAAKRVGDKIKIATIPELTNIVNVGGTRDWRRQENMFDSGVRAVNTAYDSARLVGHKTARAVGRVAKKAEETLQQVPTAFDDLWA